jgi:hypothetical protein
MHKLRRTMPWVGVGLVAGVCLTLLVAFSMLRAAPAWWRSVDRLDHATIELAKQVENAVINRMSENRQASTLDARGVNASELWSFDLTPAQANAWLNVRLPAWVDNRGETFTWPDEISELQVDFDDTGIRIGARVKAAGRHHVLSATLKPAIEPSGELWLPAKSVSLGRLEIPASWIADQAEATAAEYIPDHLRMLPETQGMFRAFAGQSPIVGSAIVRLDGERQVRILKIVPKGGVLRVICQTEERTGSGRRVQAGSLGGS